MRGEGRKEWGMTQSVRQRSSEGDCGPPHREARWIAFWRAADVSHREKPLSGLRLPG